MQVMSVLIVEDSKPQRQYLCDLCAELGIGRIEQAENGRVALNLLQQQTDGFDVLICDLEMPDLDGIELIHLLAQQQIDTAIIIASGREPALMAAVELMATSEGLRVLGSLHKPIAKAALISLLEPYNSQARHAAVHRQQAKVALSLPELEKELRQHHFLLHYQPKINMQTGQLSGVEALVRLQLQNNLIFPNDFIPQCEQYKLIDALSYEVVRLATEQHQRWGEAGLDTKISVNLSAISFDNDTFSQNIMALLEQAEVSADSLIFEVTETGIIHDIGKALAILARLRLAGAGLSIDDYGTGYSSIKQLTQIPFTELKIDRSLIDGIADKAHLQVIFESTLDMCNKLGITLVAEGIEKQADWLYLKDAGCHIAQGYYVAPPMPEAALLKWVQDGMPFFR